MAPAAARRQRRWRSAFAAGLRCAGVTMGPVTCGVHELVVPPAVAEEAAVPPAAAEEPAFSGDSLSVVSGRSAERIITYVEDLQAELRKRSDCAIAKIVEADSKANEAIGMCQNIHVSLERLSETASKLQHDTGVPLAQLKHVMEVAMKLIGPASGDQPINIALQPTVAEEVMPSAELVGTAPEFVPPGHLSDAVRAHWRSRGFDASRTPSGAIQVVPRPPIQEMDESWVPPAVAEEAAVPPAVAEEQPPLASPELATTMDTSFGQDHPAVADETLYQGALEVDVGTEWKQKYIVMKLGVMEVFASLGSFVAGRAPQLSFPSGSSIKYRLVGGELHVYEGSPGGTPSWARHLRDYPSATLTCVFDELSQNQRLGVDEIRKHLLAFGPPDVTAAAALYELRGHRPGYDMEPVSTVMYTEGAVSVPSDTAKCDPGTVLIGDAAGLWHHWESRLLRPLGVKPPRIKPHFDLKLKRSRALYASFFTEALRRRHD